jgi:glycosyltransferase involved in cell wall biosynthesis
VVFDQFGENPNIGLGGIGREALACGRPLVTLFSKEFFSNYYPDPVPAVCASTEDEILGAMIELGESKEKREDLGKKAREWMWKYHHWENVIDKYINLYEEILRKV